MIRDPFLFDLVQQELIDKYGINTVRYGGLKAYTTIDPELQERAQEAVDSCGVCYPEGGPAAGLASVDPDNGEIVALASTEGGATESEFNYAWQAHRQPGSSFKTFVLTTAIKQGIDPDTHLLRRHLAEDAGAAGRRRPGRSTTPSPAAALSRSPSATWGSVNVVFAQLDLDVGPENVTHTAHQMGIEAPLESVPAEAIGGLAIGVTPLEMADAYATLANGGIHHDPTAIGRVEFPDGKVDEPDPDSGDRVLTEGQAYEVTKILEGVITQGTGAGYTSWAAAAEAGKTGTSEELSDAWFVGYTPRYSTAVWVGHPQSREATGYGGPTAGPIWRSFMESADDGDCPEFASRRACPNSPASTAATPPARRLVERIRRRRRGKDRADKGGDKAAEGRKAKPKAATEPAPEADSRADPRLPAPRRPRSAAASPARTET